MIEPVFLTTAKVTRLQGYKNRMEKGNSDVPKFQYKVTVLFYLKLKMFPWLCVKVVNTCKIHC